MRDTTIEVSGLRKRFGPTVALDGMTFTVSPGQVTGFIGPNGAGKSTTMRVILGLDAPDAGHALIGGRPYVSLRDPLAQVGALLDAAALQPSRTARNHLLWLAHSQGLVARRVDEVIALAGLQTAARRKAGGYSLGMRQRLGIAAALLGDPPVLMFDEPFNGMDPEGIVWMRGFLAGAGRREPGGAGVQPPDERAAGHRRPCGDRRPRQGHRRHQRRGPARRPRPGTGSCCGPPRAPRRRPCWSAPGRPWPSPARTCSRFPACPPNGSWRCCRKAPSRSREVTAHRATLEQAYMELTKDAVEYRAGGPAGLTGRAAS